MTQIILNAIPFLLIILAGFLLKRFGVFKDGSEQVVAKILLNLTVPASVLRAFSGFVATWETYLLVLCGLVMSLIPSLITFFVSGLRHRDKAERGFLMLHTAGYSIGTFALPFTQTFFGDMGTGILCIFDIGNAFMSTGGNYAMACSLLRLDERGGLRETAQRLLRSVPFMTYLILFILVILRLRIPQIVLDFTAPIASANKFMAMFLIGLSIKYERRPGQLSLVLRTLGTRLIYSCAMAAAVFFLLPFDLLTRQVLAVTAFAPVGTLALVFTGRMKGDTGLAGFISSISVVLSIVTMLTVYALVS